MSLSASILSRNARSSRQSGLKKPRPLRSVSLQEPADKEVQKSLPQRQLSSGVTDMVRYEDMTCNNFPVSEGIFAMSALLAGDDRTECEDVQTSSVQTEKTSRTVFIRQNSNNSCRSSYADCESAGALSRQDSSDSRASTTSPRCCISQSSSIRNADYSKQLRLDVNSNDLDLSNFSRNEEQFENTPLATLLTPQGEKLVLAGRSMMTILAAAKILVREMGASMVSLRSEDLNEDDSTSPSQSSRNSISPLSPTPIIEQNEEEKPNIDKEVIRYSKEELLALSERDLSRKLPVNWNILMHTHAECCPPLTTMKEYFEAIDFHRHDGTLVREDRRLQDQKEKSSFPFRAEL